MGRLSDADVEAPASMSVKEIRKLLKAKKKEVARRKLAKKAEKERKTIAKMAKKSTKQETFDPDYFDDFNADVNNMDANNDGNMEIEETGGQAVGNQPEARDLVNDDVLEGDDVALSGFIKQKRELDESEKLLKVLSRSEEVDIMALGQASTSLVAKSGSTIFKNLIKPFRGDQVKVNLDTAAKMVNEWRKEDGKEDLTKCGELLLGVAAMGLLSTGVHPASRTRVAPPVMGYADLRNISPEKVFITQEDAVFLPIDLRKVFSNVLFKDNKTAKENLKELYKSFFRQCCKNKQDIQYYTMAKTMRTLKSGNVHLPIPQHLRTMLKDFGMELIGAGEDMEYDAEAAMNRIQWMTDVDDAMKLGMKSATDGTFDESGNFRYRKRDGPRSMSQRALSGKEATGSDGSGEDD